MKNVLVVWLIWIVGGVAVTIGIGFGLEAVTDLVSYQQMYAPGELLRCSLLSGLPLATVLAASAVCSGQTRRQMTKQLVWGAVIICGITVGVAGLAGLVAKFAPSFAAAHENIVPVPRVWFCRGLTYGAAIGAAIWTFFVLTSSLIRCCRRADGCAPNS